MRYLLASLLCVFTLSLTAQEAVTYPYNPDSDNDAFVASTDLLELLGLYGDAFSPAEIMIGDTGLVQWIQILSQTLQAQQELINQLQSDYNALPDGIFSGNILIWNGTAWIPESPPVDDCGVYGGDGSSCALTPITDDNIHAAVDLWSSNEDVAQNTYGYIHNWDVSSVTDMTSLFSPVSSWDGDYFNDFGVSASFNGDISAWDVSSVTNMESMFQEAHSFNVNLSSWDVSSVTNMERMFEGAHSFNGDISAWDVSSVTNMLAMFYDAESFNGDIFAWDVSSVTSMRYIFRDASIFNGDISAWDVSSVPDMLGMFMSATSFNGDISAWDVSSVTNMSTMFYEAHSFNGDISAWDVSNVTNMSRMFRNASIFNGNLSSWDVSSVTNMWAMFYNAESFNGDLSAWDVSSVTDMIDMFNGISALSEGNQCAIHTSFSSNETWPYDWSEYCPPIPCVDPVTYHGYDYSTVSIGDQCWFAENCRYLPVVSPPFEVDTLTPYYYVYGYEGIDVDDAKENVNYETYGVLYNWPAVMTDSICPSGWHVPSDAEFTELTDFLGGESIEGIGVQMKSTSGWNDGGNGSNLSGFNGLPGGHLAPPFGNDGDYGYWWSTSDSDSSSWGRELHTYLDNVNRLNYSRDYGFSARCVRD